MPPPAQAAEASPAQVRETALDWFVRRRDPGFSAEAEATFRAWLAAAPAHRDAYADWDEDWQALDAIPAEALQGIAREPAPARAGPPARRRFLVPALATTGVAAMAALAGGVGLMTWQRWQATPLFSRSYQTRRGQFADVPLPDGSRIELDTATQVEVTYYRRRREVRLLDGQALFSVTADPARPFQVDVAPLRVTVVGTRFSVRHTPDIGSDDLARVAVESGRVLVEARPAGPADRADRADQAEPTGDGDSSRDSASRRLLGAGQQVASTVEGGLTAISAVAEGGIAPWREFRVAFDNQRLDHALAELARYRDLPLPLRVRDPAVAALPITGVFDPRDLVTFRRVLPLSLPVRLRETSPGVVDIVAAR